MASPGQGEPDLDVRVTIHELDAALALFNTRRARSQRDADAAERRVNTLDRFLDVLSKARTSIIRLEKEVAVLEQALAAERGWHLSQFILQIPPDKLRDSSPEEAWTFAAGPFACEMYRPPDGGRGIGVIIEPHDGYERVAGSPPDHAGANWMVVEKIVDA